METILISKCHGVIASRAVSTNGYINQEKLPFVCSKCVLLCEIEEVCAECLGTGEVTTMEQVYAGEPHMAPIGTRACLCQKKEEEYDNQN